MPTTKNGGAEGHEIRDGVFSISNELGRMSVIVVIRRREGGDRARRLEREG